MLTWGTGNGFAGPEETYGYSQRPGIFALVADFYALAHTKQVRGLLPHLIRRLIRHGVRPNR